MPKSCQITVGIFDLIGQRIRLLLDSQRQEPGSVQVVWDGRDEQGTMMDSGICLYRVTAFTANAEKDKTEMLFQQTKKMLFVK